MFTHAISKPTARLLALLGKQDFFREPYLAGGTALALQLNHRLSFDLDFYIQKKFNEQQLLQLLKTIAPFQESQVAWQTILGDYPQVKFSIFYYQYPLLKKPVKYLGINIASLEDIAAMKVGAISSRGTRRDFIDLYFLIKHGFTIKQMLNFYNKKFGNLKNLYSHIIKSFMYFTDADSDESQLTLLIKCNWETVKNYFLSEVPKVLDEELKKIK